MTEDKSKPDNDTQREAKKPRPSVKLDELLVAQELVQRNEPLPTDQGPKLLEMLVRSGQTPRGRVK